MTVGAEPSVETEGTTPPSSASASSSSTASPLPSSPQRSQADIDALVLEGLPIVDRAVGALRRHWDVLAEDEMRSVGYEALRNCAPRHDPTRGPWPRFAYVYVSWEIRHRVYQEIRHRHRLDDRQNLAAMWLDTPGKLSDDEATQKGNLEDYLHHVMTSASLMVGAASRRQSVGSATAATAAAALDETRFGYKLRAGLETLESEQRDLIDAFYGEDATLKDLAKKRGVSYATIKRHHERALRTLSRAARSGARKNAKKE
ncbi:MAG: sigma factor-like helix-turn-helix DNA-binding protein [Myxococcota bacterium]